MKKRLRVLAEVLPQPDMVLGVRGDLDPGLKEALARALLALGESPEGRAILARIGWKKLLRARDADDDVTRAFARKLGLVY
ncbi:MAG: PhnD/SsuA/transferrin family substrate-binding protein [Candidatus Rokubacteria bacterium]|nr:PhnD/SsuA/transferrin family substrate-binding protein [Candidatus Rokubacteria bacterium]